MATPSVLTFDAEGRAVDFEVWVDDLQLFLQCNMAYGLSLFDLTSGASPAPPAIADSTVRSQWATRDAAARLAVRRCCSGSVTLRAYDELNSQLNANPLGRIVRLSLSYHLQVELVVKMVYRVRTK
ncbi:unnamed protein product [Closterium sp. NIES-53]